MLAALFPKDLQISRVWETGGRVEKRLVKKSSRGHLSKQYGSSTAFPSKVRGGERLPWVGLERAVTEMWYSCEIRIHVRMPFRDYQNILYGKKQCQKHPHVDIVKMPWVMFSVQSGCSYEVICTWHVCKWMILSIWVFTFNETMQCLGTKIVIDVIVMTVQME